MAALFSSHWMVDYHLRNMRRSLAFARLVNAEYDYTFTERDRLMTRDRIRWAWFL